MSGIDNNEKKQTEENAKEEHIKHCKTCKCSCNVKKERKEYVKRAQQNYRLRKLENDPSYADKLQQQKNNILKEIRIRLENQ